jgi:Family of unknown function (DUF6152)
MRRELTALLAGGVLVVASGAAMAHHSFAMFDQEHPIEIEGVVQEFMYTNPHSYILLEVKEQDGSIVVWNLEGRAPSLMAQDGWSRQSLMPGDNLVMTIDPLRSGAPGGSWNVKKIKFKDGRSIVVNE